MQAAAKARRFIYARIEIKKSQKRSKTIDKYAETKYNIYIIKQNKCLVKSDGKEDGHLGKGKKRRQKEKELLGQKLIRFQIYESTAAIIATIVTVLIAIVTAVLSWID